MSTTRDTKDTKTATEQNPTRQPEARSKQPDLPTSILGRGGDYEPPANTAGGGSGGSTTR
jgi:hypothetical protein